MLRPVDHSPLRYSYHQESTRVDRDINRSTVAYWAMKHEKLLRGLGGRDRKTRMEEKGVNGNSAFIARGVFNPILFCITPYISSSMKY